MTRFDWLSAASEPDPNPVPSADVLGARLAYLADAAGADAFVSCRGAVKALARLRETCVDAARPRRIVGCGGDDPALVEALAGLAAARGDTLVLAPPVSSGAPSAESLWLATETRPGEAPPFLVLGAATQTGLLGPLADVLGLVEERRLDVVLDLTAAPWAVLDELDAFRPHGFVAALDRWDGMPRGTWASLAVPLEASDEEPGLPPEAPVELPPHLVEIDAWLRGVLHSRSGFRTWPRAGEGVSPAILVLEVEGRSAEESALMLERSFGVIVDPGPLAAAPLPPPPGFSGEPIRLALHPSHDERAVEPLVQGLLRLVENPRLVPTLH